MEDNRGEEWLHKRNPVLHTSPPVRHEEQRRRRAGEEVSQRPEDKLSYWMDVLERTHMGYREDPQVLDRIKQSYHEQFVIKPEDIPPSYFENQRRLAREQGYGDIEITSEMRRQGEEFIISDQKSSLDIWIDYFTSPDSDSFPMWAKYWAFTGMLKLSTFDKEKHSFGLRNKNTVAPFPDLNREALAYVLDAIIKKVEGAGAPVDAEDDQFQKLLRGANFGKLYAWAIEKSTPSREPKLAKGGGKWVMYAQGSNHMPLVEALQGHGTGWCTAGETTAEAQLRYGPLYVYYSNDTAGNPTIPRVAIRFEGTKIAEVRGVGPDQNLDPLISQSGILDSKLAGFGQEGEKYKERVKDMNRLTNLDSKHRLKEDFTPEDLRFLYEIEDGIEGFGYRRDPRIQGILQGRDTKEDLSRITGFSEDEISLTPIEALREGIRYHHGDLDLRSLTSAEGLELPDAVGGDLDLGSLTEHQRRALRELNPHLAAEI